MNAAIINDINYCKLCTPSQFLVTNTTGNGPKALAAAQTYFRYAVVTALKTLAGGANTGAVNLGASATASQQPILLNAGDSYVIRTPEGGKFDFRDWYFTVANDGDGLVVIYS